MTTLSHIVERHRDLVRQYRVLWTILPKRLPESLKGQRIGFDLELWGTHAHPGESGECFDCRRMLEALNDIAAYVVPHHCGFRTSGGVAADARTRSHPLNGFGKRLKISLEVVCRNGHSALDSQCDAGCLLAMREKLLSLGARRI